MNICSLDPHCQLLLEEYRQEQETFQIMRRIVRQELEKCIADNGIYVTAIETRIKTEKSLVGKLELKGRKYLSLADVTDILGARVITFYTDEVDKVSALIEKLFVVDWDNSVDKRKLLDLDQFGYMSLHYICSIPASLYSDPEHPKVNDYRFEIQMRTALQHVWATMDHDTGYKSGIEVPKEHLRNLNRLAGMLELADEEFSRIRREIIDYRRNVSSLVASGNFDEVPLDGDTFRNFLQIDPFRKLITRIASVNQAEVVDDSLMSYLDVLIHLGFSSLGDINRLIADFSDEAYQLSLHQLAGTDLDIVALSLALQNLCVIYLLKQGAGMTGLQEFYCQLGGTQEGNAQRAQRTFDLAKQIHII